MKIKYTIELKPLEVVKEIPDKVFLAHRHDTNKLDQLLEDNAPTAAEILKDLKLTDMNLDSVYPTTADGDIIQIHLDKEYPEKSRILQYHRMTPFTIDLKDYMYCATAEEAWNLIKADEELTDLEINELYPAFLDLWKNMVSELKKKRILKHFKKKHKHKNYPKFKATLEANKQEANNIIKTVK